MAQAVLFILRKGIRSHNGAPFTSKDVAFSIEQLQNEQGSLQGAYVQGVEVDTPDDYTVVLNDQAVPSALLRTRLYFQSSIGLFYGKDTATDLESHSKGTGHTNA